MNNLGFPHRISYAQNREDIFLEYFFRDTKGGFYVDVGANDPIEDSVTKIFYDNGWSGINVEPIKRLHDALELARPRDTNLNIGISSKPGKTTFREFHQYHGLSTMSPEMRAQYQSHEGKDKRYADYTDHEVRLDTLAHVFKEHAISSIQFMKVDVEGYEYDVLAGNDWSKYRPQVICIEANHIMKDWRPLLKNQHYSLVFNDGLNDYYVAEEVKRLGEQFSYVHAALPSPILAHNVVDAINDTLLKSTIEKNALVFRNSELSLKIGELGHRLMVANSELESNKRLKSIVRNLILKIDNIIEERIYPASDRNKLQVLLPGQPVPIEKTLEAQISAINLYDEEHLQKLHLASNKSRLAILDAYRTAKKPFESALMLAWKCLRWAKRKVKG